MQRDTTVGGARDRQRISCRYQNHTRRCNLDQANDRAVGVDFEEAGEKWRAGDSAKSLRFFVRAIDVYDAVNPSTHHPSTTHNTTSILKHYSAQRQ